MRRRYFRRSLAAAEQFTEDDSFVVLPAYEWTKQPNVGGHVNVYFDDPDAAVLFDSITPETATYEGLWDRLREWRADPGHDARVLTIRPR